MAKQIKNLKLVRPYPSLMPHKQKKERKKPPTHTKNKTAQALKEQHRFNGTQLTGIHPLWFSDKAAVLQAAGYG